MTRAEIELGIALVPEGGRKDDLRAAAERMFAEFHGRCLAFDESAAQHTRRWSPAACALGAPSAWRTG